MPACEQKSQNHESNFQTPMLEPIRKQHNTMITKAFVTFIK
jgi:hypothetical protein